MYWLLDIFLSLLPEPWRRRWDVEPYAAYISGAIQAAVCFGTLVLWYAEYLQRATMSLPHDWVLGVAETRGETGLMAFGPIFFVQFFLHPAALVLWYLGFEGLLRATTALITRDIVGTLPLYLLMRAQQKVTRVVRRWAENVSYAR